MKGIHFFTTLGLLLVQALGALFLGVTYDQSWTGIISCIVFLLLAIGFLSRGLFGKERAAVPAVIGFSLAFFHIIYYSFFSGSLWLVILLSLNAAGFILSLDALVAGKKRRDESLIRRIMQERLRTPPVMIEVYDEKQAEKPAKKTSKKKTAQKRSKKKTAQKTSKKTRGRPKKTVKKP